MGNKSFTLIELLVVIAIIGLLSTLVFVNMQGARAKAHDANIQSMMHQVRNVAELIYDQNETYSQVCDNSDDTLRNQNDELDILENALIKENAGEEVRCFEGPGNASFAASFPMVFKEDKHWCIESAGLSIEIDNEITSADCE